MLEDVIYILLYIYRERDLFINPIKPGGVIFVRGKFEFKLFLNDFVSFRE